jgi:hypothetical protein
MTAFSISPFFVKYIAIWALFCVAAVFILIWERKRLLPEWRKYLRFLERCPSRPAHGTSPYKGNVHGCGVPWHLTIGSGDRGCMLLGSMRLALAYVQK